MLTNDSPNGNTTVPETEENNIVLDIENTTSTIFDLDLFILANAKEASENRLNRTETLLNTVEFTSGKTGKVSVTRLIAETVTKINRQHEFTTVGGKPVNFERVFTAKYSTIFNGETISKQLGVIGITSEKRAYLLTSTYNLAVQRASGEDYKVLQAMIATVTKAINLATKYGLYDAHNFAYSNVKTQSKIVPVSFQDVTF